MTRCHFASVLPNIVNETGIISINAATDRGQKPPSTACLSGSVSSGYRHWLVKSNDRTGDAGECTAWSPIIDVHINMCTYSWSVFRSSSKLFRLIVASRGCIPPLLWSIASTNYILGSFCRLMLSVIGKRLKRTKLLRNVFEFSKISIKCQLNHKVSSIYVISIFVISAGEFVLRHWQQL